MLGSYLQQTTSADDIFRCIFFLGALRFAKGSFFPRTIRDWNAIPASIISPAEVVDDGVAKFTDSWRDS